jgi:hypothetical protein
MNAQLFEILFSDCLEHIVSYVDERDYLPFALSCSAVYHYLWDEHTDNFGRIPREDGWFTSYSDTPSRLEWAMRFPPGFRPRISDYKYGNRQLVQFACREGFLDTLKYCHQRGMIGKARALPIECYTMRHYEFNDCCNVGELAKDICFTTPIHNAAYGGNTHVIEWLLDNKLDIIDSPILPADGKEINDDTFWNAYFRRERYTAASLAAFKNDTSTTQFLLSRGADFGIGATSVFVSALKNGNIPLLHYAMNLFLEKYGLFKINGEINWEGGISLFLTNYSNRKECLPLEHIKWLCNRFQVNALGEVEVVEYKEREPVMVGGFWTGVFGKQLQLPDVPNREEVRALFLGKDEICSRG